jgi:diaminohydroxyphosphoribosylaminopyrimidine deaminase/5-amino-6-(5-phosphoribosylamino)uracil reductase
VAEALDPAFFHTARHRAPFVALKLAVSLDGRIAARPGERTPVSGREAEREVHRLRSGFDAILVGAGTWRADDPQLTVRHAPPGRTPPRRMVLDPKAELPGTAALLREASTIPVHVFTRRDAREAEMERLEDVGAHVHPVPADRDGRLDLDTLLTVSWELGIRSVLCEGGARLGASLLRGGIARRLYLFLAPRALGPSGVPGFPEGSETLPWDAFSPAFPPELHGRDTLLVLDREDV